MGFPILFQVLPPSVDDSQYKIDPVYPLRTKKPELTELGQTAVAPDKLPPTDCAFALNAKHISKINKWFFTSIKITTRPV